MRSTLVVLLVVLAAGYVALLLLLRLNETRLVFPSHYDDRALVPPPLHLALPVERIALHTADSVVLAAWVIPAADTAAPWLLLCHGNGGNISTAGRPVFYRYLRATGANILAFDYRGYGESEGVPTEAGLYRDARAAYDHLRAVRGVPPERIVVHGHSLGSAVAVELATRVPVAGLILEGALTSVTERGREIFPFLPVHWIAASRFPSIERIAEVRVPKLFLHAAADEVIPIAHGRRLYAAAAEPKRFVMLEGGHADAYLEDRERFFGEIAAFVARVGSRSP